MNRRPGTSAARPRPRRATSPVPPSRDHHEPHIDEHEELLTFARAAKHYPRGTSVQTLIRHATRGIKVPDGVVKLEAWRLGGRWTTTAAAIERFKERLTARRGATPPPSSDRQARAKAVLDALGV